MVQPKRAAVVSKSNTFMIENFDEMDMIDNYFNFDALGLSGQKSQLGKSIENSF